MNTLTTGTTTEVTKSAAKNWATRPVADQIAYINMILERFEVQSRKFVQSKHTRKLLNRTKANEIQILRILQKFGEKGNVATLFIGLDHIHQKHFLNALGIEVEEGTSYPIEPPDDYDERIEKFKLWDNFMSHEENEWQHMSFELLVFWMFSRMVHDYQPSQYFESKSYQKLKATHHLHDLEKAWQEAQTKGVKEIDWESCQTWLNFYKFLVENHKTEARDELAQIILASRRYPRN